MALAFQKTSIARPRSPLPINSMEEGSGGLGEVSLEVNAGSAAASLPLDDFQLVGAGKQRKVTHATERNRVHKGAVRLANRARIICSYEHVL